MMAATRRKYYAVIVGSGQAGTPLASAFAKAGHRTAIIERSHIGGCCVNEGCTPTKTLISSGRVAHLTRRGQDYGIHTSSPPSTDGRNQVIVDMAKVRSRKRSIVTSFRGGNEKSLKDAEVDIFLGHASFASGNLLKVSMNDGSQEEISAEKVFINVGERPSPPDLEGVEKIEKSRVLDSTSIQELDVVPEHLIIIGGGYVGVEFAQLFQRLGSKVTILQRGKQLLPREDKEIADTLLEILEEDGLKVHLQSSATQILPMYNEGIELKFNTASGEEAISGTHILFAAGRIPNTDTLDLQAAGVSINAKGYIQSNEFLETTNPNVFVLGDVKGPPAFTHISYDDFRIIKANHLPEKANSTVKLSTKNRIVPYVVYTDPQLAHVGLHEHEARAKFSDSTIKVARMPMSYVARALETDESRGIMKAVINADTGLILGFTCLGIEGGELMAVVQMAIMSGTRWEVLRDAVWAHPSLAECLNNLWGFLE